MRGGAAAGRRPPRAVETLAVPRKARSEAMRLAAEVERLERDLASARSQVAELALRVDIDPLTELPNRRAFERELARSLAYVKRHETAAALLYVDLDDFKSVNDRHGHAAGDAVLRAVARVLGRHVRASDVVARIGGDEFVVLLWNCDEANAHIKAMAIEAAIVRTTATHAGTVLMAAASVGATALLPLDEPAATLERADAAMYARKAARHAVS
jgi:diguanylate cyclase (GGDEF)-like protein